MARDQLTGSLARIAGTLRAVTGRRWGRSEPAMRPASKQGLAGDLGTVARLLLCLMVLSPAAGRAEPPPLSAQASDEINFLLADMGSSGCEFLRNGTWYGAQKAQAHLNEKYQWLKARGRIRSAEDFIDLAASRSSLSGQAYAVRCGGKPPVSSGSWLTEKLRRYRDSGGAPRAGP